MKACAAPVRPEERRRHIECPAWADTVPAGFRSEAFAEDLFELPSAAPAPRSRQRSAARREQAPAMAAQSAR